MAVRRNIIMDAPVNPAIMGGLIFMADTCTASTGNTLSVSFPAKTVLAVITSSAADTDAEKVTWSSSITNNIATVIFTVTSAGTNRFSYIIVATATEVVDANTITESSEFDAGI
jgi:hypothetical protein